jgi:hypothetical protein
MPNKKMSRDTDDIEALDDLDAHDADDTAIQNET